MHWLEVEEFGRRPVLVLTDDPLSAVLRRVLVAGATTTIRGVDSEVALDVDDGMPRPCAVNLLDLTVVPRALLVERITTLGQTKMARICEALSFVTGC